MRRSTRIHFSKFYLLRLLAVIVIVSFSALLNAQPGTAPVNPPVGGMKIDGFLQRQDVLIGDWLKGGPGGSLPAGSYIFKDDGTAEVPYNGAAYVGKIFHKTDLFNNQTSDDIFDGGNKLHQDPNVWRWRSQKPPAKDDINHSLVFITKDADDDVWVLITGDRMSTNGTSYLDIEFYQNSIAKTGGPLTGGFVANGPHAGRTIGDIDVTLSYTGGGSVATVSFLQWAPGSEAGAYQWMSLTPPAGSAYVAANNGFVINVPYGAYGKTTYKSLQFIEAAINLSELIGEGTGGGPCQSLPFHSIFIKTKSSASPTADLKDFIAPFAINFCTDDIAPQISASGNNTALGCNPSASAINGALGSATATDACSTPTVTFIDGAVQSTNCNRSQVRRFTATDECGNTATTSRTANWVADPNGPVFTGSYSDVNLGCNPANPDGSLGTATASDACGGTTITSSDGDVVSNNCNRSRTRTFTARDGCNNTSTISRTVRWVTDNTAPQFTGSYADVILGCSPANPDGSLGTATATDACGAVTITSSDGSLQSDGCNRSKTRTFTARDGCNLTATISRTVRWKVDNTPPSFSGVYTDVNLGCNPESPSGSLGTATASDACGGVTITSDNFEIQVTGCNRSQTRKFTARDDCGNTATISRTVRWVEDNTPPTFTGVYTDVNLGCNPANPDGSLGTASATDACGAVTITQSDGSIVSDVCNRSKTRTFTARDGCNNTSTTSRTVRWVEDQTPPAFTGVYTDVVLACNPANPDGSLGTATATDACGAVTITSNDGSLQSDGCNRSKTRTFTARDGCNNTATISRTVRWIADNTPPEFTGQYIDIFLDCNPINPAGSLGTATATDACGAVTITSLDIQTFFECLNRITRTFTARDACGNTATRTRTVSWTADNTPPAFTGVYTDVVLGCNPANPDGSLGTATATDACGAVTITSNDGNLQSDGCNRSKTRTFTARDGCNNTSTTSRTVRWIEDQTPPAFTGVYTDVVLGCNPANPDGSLGTATATDVCGAVTISSNDGPIVSDGCNRSKTRTFTARDGCNNTATTSRTVRWIEDQTPPAFTGVYTDVVLACNPANPDGSLGTATATDACGAVTISSNDGTVVSTGCNRSKTRTFTARDGCNNTSTTSRTVRWIEDVTPPVFTLCPGDFTATCNQTIPDCSPTDVTATDACGPVTITCSTETDIEPGGGGASCTNCDPPAPASECTPPSSYAADVVVNNNTTWATLFPAISADNITSAIRITGTGKVTVTSGDVILKSASAVLVIEGVEFVVNNGNLKLDNAGSRFIMTNGILRTYGNMEQKPLSFVCITNSTVEIGDEAAGGLFNTGGSSTSANFQNDGGYRYLRGVCLNVTHDLQLSSTGNGTAAGGGLDIFINVCAEIGDRGSTNASTGTVDGDDSGNLQNNKNMQFYCSEFVVMENIQNQSSSSMSVCETDFRTLNGSLQNAGTLSGTGLCLAIDDQINNTGTWTVTVDGWYAGGSVTGVTLGTESTLAAVLANCFGDCSCTSSCSGTITRTWTATDACGNTATCKQVITLSDNATRNFITNNSLQQPTMDFKPVPVDELKVSAFPNPFTDNVRFVIQSPISGQGSLEIYNLLGQRLQVVYKGFINAGVNQVVEYRPVTTTSTLIYRFRINSQQVTGKLINIGDSY